MCAEAICRLRRGSGRGATRKKARRAPPLTSRTREWGEWRMCISTSGATRQLGLTDRRLGREGQPVGRVAAREMLLLVLLAPARQPLGDVGLDGFYALGAAAGQGAARQDALGGVIELAQKGGLPAVPHIGPDVADVAYRQDQQPPQAFGRRHQSSEGVA